MLDRTHFKPFNEAYQVGPNTIELLLANGRRIRVTALLDLKSEAGGYDAYYEERREVSRAPDDLADDEPTWTWVETADFPSAQGRLIEECLGSALNWVREQAG
jgi:hypothetical protein